MVSEVREGHNEIINKLKSIKQITNYDEIVFVVLPLLWKAQ